MLFQRRIPESHWQKARVAMWPRRSFRRSLAYTAKRIMRLRSSPHSIALGVSIGVFAAFNPLLGLHTVLAVALAWAFGGNLIAAALATWAGNPLTYPLIWAGTFELGSVILGSSADAGQGAHGAHLSFRHLSALWEPLLKPMLVGSIPLGIVTALVAYVVVRRMAASLSSARAPAAPHPGNPA
ncbi:MAG: DUF2062 domain-containing protein [Rhizobiaceae bacterium]